MTLRAAAQPNDVAQGAADYWSYGALARKQNDVRASLALDRTQAAVQVRRHIYIYICTFNIDYSCHARAKVPAAAGSRAARGTPDPRRLLCRSTQLGNPFVKVRSSADVAFAAPPAGAPSGVPAAAERAGCFACFGATRLDGSNQHTSTSYLVGKSV